jgi:hypothetical protein
VLTIPLLRQNRVRLSVLAGCVRVHHTWQRLQVLSSAAALQLHFIESVSPRRLEIVPQLSVAEGMSLFLPEKPCCGFIVLQSCGTA